MTKSTSTTAESGGKRADEPGEMNGTYGTNGASDPFDADYSELLDQAKSWIEANQTLAMLGGFGFGVFIGVLLRK